MSRNKPFVGSNSLFDVDTENRTVSFLLYSSGLDKIRAYSGACPACSGDELVQVLGALVLCIKRGKNLSLFLYSFPDLLLVLPLTKGIHVIIRVQIEQKRGSSC